MEAFPQAQKYIPSYQDGGDQQQVLMQYIQAFAQLQGVPPEQIIQALQQMPEQQQSQAIQQIVQMVDQVMSQQGQGQGQPQGMDMAQSGEMPMDPNQAVQMALGGAYNLKKFTDPYPAAAELPDSPIYRTMPPNIPRLFAEGGALPMAKNGQQTTECPFGHYFDPNVGKCVPHSWYTASKFVGGAGALMGLGAAGYKGIPYMMERREVVPGRRPIRGFGNGDFIMEDLEKNKIGDKVRNWSYFGEEIPLQRTEYEYERTGPKSGKKTTIWSHANDPAFEKKILNDKNVKATGNERTIETGEKYLKYSDYGNAKWVQENITPKFGITPQEWAKMGTTPEGKILQKSLVTGLKSPNYASVMKGLETSLLKYKNAPLTVKIGIAAPLLGLGLYGLYNWWNSPDESPTEIPQGGISNPDTSSEGELQRQLELFDKQDQLKQQGPQTMPADTSKWMPKSWLFNKMGGSSSPMGYGMFPAIMREGGSFSNASPDIYDTEGYLNNYNDNEFKRYIQENIDNSIYERGLKAASFPTMDQMRPMQMQARRGGSSKKKILDKYAVDGETNPWSSVWNNPVNPFANQSYYLNADQPGENRYTETDPNQSINTLTGQEDEPTTGSAAPNAPQGPTITLDPNQNPSKNIYDNQFDPNKEKAEEAMRVGQNMTQKCPKGQKWDPVRQECYREKYVSNQANANAIITGLNAAGMLADRFSGNKRKEENKQIIGTLADSVMPKKDYNGVDFYGYEDVNTFTPNPRYGTYNRSVYQPPGSEYMADGGEIQYLTKKQINDLLAKGGQIEFL